MRSKLGLRAARSMICRYGENIDVYRSSGGHYDKDSMKWLGNGREKIRCFIAFFPNGGMILDSDGRRQQKTAKFYSKDEIICNDKENEQSDVIVYQDIAYIVDNVEKRVEAGCRPVYIGICSIYKGRDKFIGAIGVEK